MKIAALISLFAAASSSFAARTLSVSYDQGYDQASRSMTVVSCSDGANGLITRYGWNTQGQIPRFPNVAGSVDIGGWNSAQCGTCYQVTYKGKSIFVLGIDHTDTGINMSLGAMNQLTNNQAVQLGRVNAQVTKVGVGKCGLTPQKREIEFEA
ncbi:hypothetical protein LTR37_019024 [Vermiconidia calcicola]|uniref:Uncharacterized protein n=1 Tax=Vermiconidia calcicola TaxID=1690605 RepID=A0ACC3MFB8_9PEZI|nr:hypothetical protein LTR37_019024 [Vermiconidia calcicola]